MEIIVEMKGTLPIINLSGFILEHYHSFEDAQGYNIDKFRSVVDPDMKIIITSLENGPKYDYIIEDLYVTENSFDWTVDRWLEVI